MLSLGNSNNFSNPLNFSKFLYVALPSVLNLIGIYNISEKHKNLNVKKI